MTKLVGTGPDQVPTNSMLGNMAYMNIPGGAHVTKWHHRSVFAQLNTTAVHDVGFYTAPNYTVATRAEVLEFDVDPTTTHLMCWYKIGGSTTSNFPSTADIRGAILYKATEYNNSTDLNSDSGYSYLAPTFRQYNTSTVYNWLSTRDPYTGVGRAHGRASQDHYAWSDMQTTMLRVSPGGAPGPYRIHFKARVTGGTGNMRRCYMLHVAEVSLKVDTGVDENTNYTAIDYLGENQNERTA